jgi:hypothetical protein
VFDYQELPHPARTGTDRPHHREATTHVTVRLQNTEVDADAAVQAAKDHGRPSDASERRLQVLRFITIYEGIVGQELREDTRMRIGSVVLALWLIVGLIAAAQRDYLNGKVEDCNAVATITVTILAGPLNYLGMNPKISCETPQPSK